MKPAILLSLSLLLGCSKSKANYVRSHKCIQTGQSSDEKFYFGGSVHIYEGSRVYACPDGVTVVIFNNEARP